MDRHDLYRNWGITATPVIDVATSTIYVTTFGRPNVASPNTERNNMLSYFNLISDSHYAQYECISRATTRESRC